VRRKDARDPDRPQAPEALVPGNEKAESVQRVDDVGALIPHTDDGHRRVGDVPEGVCKIVIRGAEEVCRTRRGKGNHDHLRLENRLVAQHDLVRFLLACLRAHNLDRRLQLSAIPEAKNERLDELLEP
jgi:hypothetical protein